MGNQCAGAGGLSNHSTKAPTTAERSKGPGEWGGIGTTSIGVDQGAYGRRGISLKSCISSLTSDITVAFDSTV